MGPTLQVVELERKPAVGHRVTRSEKSVFPRASIPRPSAGQAFGIRGLSSGGVEGAGRGAERLLTEGKVLGKRRILRFGNYRDSSPCLPNWGRLSTSPQPTHPPASWLAVIHQGRSAVISALSDHRTQEP